MRALAYAASLQQPVVALHVSPSEAEAERFRVYWDAWGDHLPLEIVVSAYRVIVGPIVNYLASLHQQRPDLTLTVILPEIVVRRRTHSSSTTAPHRACSEHCDRWRRRGSPDPAPREALECWERPFCGVWM